MSELLETPHVSDDRAIKIAKNASFLSTALMCLPLIVLGPFLLLIGLLAFVITFVFCLCLIKIRLKYGELASQLGFLVSGFLTGMIMGSIFLSGSVPMSFGVVGVLLAIPAWAYVSSELKKEFVNVA